MDESESPLEPLIDNEKDLRAEFRRRNSIWDLISVNPSDEPDYVATGWEPHRKLKTKIRLRKLRVLDERLEDKWWVLLYKMGYKEMNSGRNFRILMKRRYETETSKQIDVFARDDETIIVAECKACERLKTRSLQKDLEEFGALKSDLSKAIKKFYGADFKPKILWFFITENVIWSEPDIARAKTHNIRRVTENELPYYTQLAAHLGKAARFQFLAEFLKDQPIPNLENIKVPATRGRLGNKYFYSFVTTPRHLLKIAFVNHRTLNDPEGYPTYQRLIQKTRLKEIGNFILNGGFFANNLLVNFMKTPRFDIVEKDVNSDVHYGQVYLPSTYKSAWIIDGQHRLYGYAQLPDKYLDQKLIVLAFDGLKPDEEATLFVTINHEQRSVPKNLLDDLEGQLKWESEDPNERIGALSARLFQQLNIDLSSPFYKRFTAEGLQSTVKSCLTLPQVKGAIRRSKLLGQALSKVDYEKGLLCGSTDNASLARAQKILNGFFSAIYNADAGRWDSGSAGRICTNVGIQSFVLLLGETSKYLYSGDVSKFLNRSETQIIQEVLTVVDPVVEFIKTSGPAFDQTFAVPYGSGGPRQYFFRLVRIVRAKFPDFGPEDYPTWETEQRHDLRRQADEQLQSIVLNTQKHIFLVFKKIYGNEGYFEKAVTNKEMQVNAFKKSIDDDVDVRGPKEQYLDFLDLKKIVESREKWRFFKAEFDIPINETKGHAKNVDWMERINELRRIPAHPAENRNYRVEDFDFINRISSILQDRLGDFNYDAIESEVQI